MNTIQRLLCAAGLVIGTVASSSVFAIAVPYTVTVGGSATQALGPSADTLGLHVATTSTSLGSFVLQTATFFVGDSGNLMDQFPFTIDETVTINGQSLIVPLSGTLIVTNPSAANTDSFSFSNGTSIDFASAGVFLTPTFSPSPAGGVGQGFTFNVLANLTTAAVVPEPDGLALFLLGLTAIGGVALATKKRDDTALRGALLPA